jgi:flagellar motor protein MotB
MGVGVAFLFTQSLPSCRDRSRGCPRVFWSIAVTAFLCLPSFGCNRGFPTLTTSPTGLLTFSPPVSPSSTSRALGTPTPSSGIASPINGPAQPPSSSVTATTGFSGATPTLPGGLGLAQNPDFERQLRSLDAANQQLNAQLAQAQQQIRFYKDRSDLMQRQLADVSGQLQTRLASNPAPYAPSPNASKPPDLSTAKEFGSSNARRSGARFTANVSRGQEADPLRDLGYDVEVAGDGMRLRIPSDQLFQPNSAQLTPSGTSLLDRIAEILKTEYSDRRMAIEGYTDNAPLHGGLYSTSHQLTSAQTDAILEQWTRRNQLPSSQFVTLAHGSNYPISDNQSPAGRAANRRIEILIRNEVSP